jgi:predicted ester cyclase
MNIRLFKSFPTLLLLALVGCASGQAVEQSQKTAQIEAEAVEVASQKSCASLEESADVPFPCTEEALSNEQLEANKGMVHEFFVTAWEQKDFALIDEKIPLDAKDYSPLGSGQGPESFKGIIGMFHEAIEGITAEGSEMAEGDLVTHFWKISGTHSKGPIFGVPPTNQKLTLTGTTTVRIKDGKIVARWSQLDMFGFMQQLGVIPPTGGEASPAQ